MSATPCIVRIEFRDLKRKCRITCTHRSEGLLSIDDYMYKSISDLGFHPDPGDKFEILSFKVYNANFYKF